MVMAGAARENPANCCPADCCVSAALTWTQLACLECSVRSPNWSPSGRTLSRIASRGRRSSLLGCGALCLDLLVCEERLAFFPFGANPSVLLAAALSAATSLGLGFLSVLRELKQRL